MSRGLAFTLALAGLALVHTSAAMAAAVGHLPVSSQVLADADASVVSVFDGFIPRSEQAAIRSGTSTYDTTKDILSAVEAVRGTGRTLRFPKGTYYVRELIFSGSNYGLDTSAATFQQIPGLTGDAGTHPIMTFGPNASDIRVGDLSLRGNIASDVDEYSHGVAVISAKRITIGDIYGENIRGDVLYTYGRTTSESEHLRQLSVGVVRGRNIFRCIVALVGGEIAIAGIVQDGAVGYRTLDVEPNAGGAYQPVEATVGFIRGSTVQITSDDPEVINASVTIKEIELDGDYIADSSPSYPRHPGRNAIALAINRTDSVTIGRLSIRNYDSYPVQLADGWRSVRIGTLDFANSNTAEMTYKAVILQYGEAGDGVLSINRLTGRLTRADRFLLRSDRGRLKVDIGSVEVSGGQFGAYLSGSVGRIARSAGGSPACLDCENITFGAAAGHR